MIEKVRADALFSALPPLRQLPDFYARGYPLRSKMVVLDDDPTGVQTVHGVSVYVSWSYDELKAALLEDGHVFFVLTNSRALSAAETERLHRELVQNLCLASRDTGVPFVLLSRSDSTLRGHYPLETATLRQGLLSAGLPDLDGEILAPFFPEGGRFTINDVHYVRENDVLIPAGETEFAKDATFGYTSSNLIDWVREKNPRLPSEEAVLSVGLDTIRLGGPDAVENILRKAHGFQKIIVNSADYADMEVFVEALYRVLGDGKRFLFRCAAGLVRVMACIPTAPLLSGAHLREDTGRGGLVMVGSHVQKTTRQLQRLLELDGLCPLEMDVRRLTDPRQAESAVEEAVSAIEKAILSGRTAVAFTSRELVKVTAENSEQNLAFSLRVSDALVRIVQKLSVRPAFFVAKGGVTSSDIGVKGLSVRRAEVLGQALAGVPVWRLGPESKYPGLSYVVFPGNVGGEDALLCLVQGILGR